MECNALSETTRFMCKWQRWAVMATTLFASIAFALLVLLAWSQRSTRLAVETTRNPSALQQVLFSSWMDGSPQLENELAKALRASSGGRECTQVACATRFGFDRCDRGASGVLTCTYHGVVRVVFPLAAKVPRRKEEIQIDVRAELQEVPRIEVSRRSETFNF